jgi:hypothetical protein
MASQKIRPTAKAPSAKSERRGDARHLTEINLLEVSVVLFRTQPLVLIDTVKSELGDR